MKGTILSIFLVTILCVLPPSTFVFSETGNIEPAVGIPEKGKVTLLSQGPTQVEGESQQLLVPAYLRVSPFKRVSWFVTQSSGTFMIKPLSQESFIHWVHHLNSDGKLKETEFIEWVQRSLNRQIEKESRIEVTGKITAQYREAVKIFKRRVGLPPNGEVDAATAKALIKGNESNPSYASWVNQALMAINGDAGPGQFTIDSGTRKALKHYQSIKSKHRRHLTEDGVVGFHTELALILEFGQPPPTPLPDQPKPKPSTKPRTVCNATGGPAGAPVPLNRTDLNRQTKDSTSCTLNYQFFKVDGIWRAGQQWPDNKNQKRLILHITTEDIYFMTSKDGKIWRQGFMGWFADVVNPLSGLGQAGVTLKPTQELIQAELDFLIGIATILNPVALGLDMLKTGSDLYHKHEKFFPEYKRCGNGLLGGLFILQIHAPTWYEFLMKETAARVFRELPKEMATPKALGKLVASIIKPGFEQKVHLLLGMLDGLKFSTQFNALVHVPAAGSAAFKTAMNELVDSLTTIGNHPPSSEQLERMLTEYIEHQDLVSFAFKEIPDALRCLEDILIKAEKI